MKSFINKYRHIWPFLVYFPIYMIWFCLLEKNITDYHIIHSRIDDIIPFVEYFIIPYYLWFPYVIFTIALAFFTDKKEYWHTVKFLVTGMTIFLIVSTVYPNGLNLRPAVFPRDNFCTRLCLKLYSADTSTNVIPSIHVFNSLGCLLCIFRCGYTRKKRWLTIAATVLTTLIILSTMFIKQHSVLDVAAASVMALVVYFIVYKKHRK